jgi:hypothetical protein
MGWPPPITKIADNGEEYLRDGELDDIVSFFELAKKTTKEKEKDDKWGDGLDYIRFLFGYDADGLLRDQYGKLWFPTRNLSQMMPMLQNMSRWFFSSFIFLSKRNLL